MMEIYLYFGTNLKGESKAAGRANWIDINSWGFNVAQRHRAGGEKEESVKPEFSNIMVKKEVDRASPTLMQACAQGGRYNEVIIEQCKAGSTPGKPGEATGGTMAQRPFLRITLGDVYIEKYTVAGNETGYPTDEFELNYQRITYGYTEQKETGAIAPKPTVEVEYDLEEQKA